MKNVYICEPNCRIHKNGEYLTVRKSSGKISDISLLGVQTILLFGNIQITTQAVLLILEKGIDLLFLTSGGRLRGRASGEQGKNVLVRIAQYDAWFREDIRLQTAKEIVEKKLQNQKENLKYYRYRKKLSQLRQQEQSIDQIIKKLKTADSVSEIMGLEGSAAAGYFSVFSLLFQDFSFEKRVRRPAYDPVNAILNLTYTFLKNEISTILRSASFDVQLGFLHDVRSGRESLALDFMESYRPAFADRFAIALLNKRKIRQEDFELSEEGIRLKTDGMKQYCSYFQKAIYEETLGGKTWKQQMEQDVMRFRKKLLSLHNQEEKKKNKNMEFNQTGGDMKIWYTISYDISEDKARRKIEKLCSTYLQRVQYSVFEGYLSEAEFTKFFRRLQELCRKVKWNPAADSILIYPHCKACYAGRMVLGKTIASSESYLII